MSIRSYLHGRLGAGAAILALAALPAAAGLAHVAPAAADNPSYPVGVGGAFVGTVQVLQSSNPAEVEVTLIGATPDATYTVSDCSLSTSESMTCAGDASDTITTDTMGNGMETFTFNPGPASSDVIKIVNNANPAETYLTYVNYNNNEPVGVGM
jgi:hypothetical protein